MIFDPGEQLEAINESYERIRSLLAKPAPLLFEHTPVSGWNAAQQLEHILAVNRTIIKAFRYVDRQAYSEDHELSKLGAIILTRGRIKRGVAKAPEKFHAGETVSIDGLRKMELLQSAYFKSANPSTRSFSSQTGTADHPYFGPLNGNQWLRLARVHTEHHLSIIDDIVSSENSESPN